jgi:hypothetical protein
MKRNYFRLFVVFLGAALLAGVASAGESDRIIVNIPYDFVASGKTLPAGLYIVQRLSDSNYFPLSISSRENGSTVFVQSTEVKEASQSHPRVDFLVSGDQHFLTSVQTAEHVFSFPVSPSTIRQAANSHTYLTGTSESTRH